MANLNRTSGISEQRREITLSGANINNGATLVMGPVPWPSVVDCGQLVAFGLSGAPTYAVIAQRFIVGSGITQITVATGASNAAVEYGTSGVGASGLVIGTSILLLPNDMLTVVSGGGTGAASKGVAVTLELRPLQDVKVPFGMYTVAQS